MDGTFFRAANWDVELEWAIRPPHEEFRRKSEFKNSKPRNTSYRIQSPKPSCELFFRIWPQNPIFFLPLIIKSRGLFIGKVGAIFWGKSVGKFKHEFEFLLPFSKQQWRGWEKAVTSAKRGKKETWGRRLLQAYCCVVSVATEVDVCWRRVTGYGCCTLSSRYFAKEEDACVDRVGSVFWYVVRCCWLGIIGLDLFVLEYRRMSYCELEWAAEDKKLAQIRKGVRSFKK